MTVIWGIIFVFALLLFLDILSDFIGAIIGAGLIILVLVAFHYFGISI